MYWFLSIHVSHSVTTECHTKVEINLVSPKLTSSSICNYVSLVCT